MKEMFVSLEELEEMEYEYNIEDNGISGRYYGYNWYTATNEEGEVIELYLKWQENVKYLTRGRVEILLFLAKKRENNRTYYFASVAIERIFR